MPAAAGQNQLPDYGEVMQPPNCILDEHFIVSDVDHSRFEKVGRISAAADKGGPDASFELDVYTEIYSVQERERLHVVLLKQLNPDTALTDAFEHDERNLGKSICDHFEYVTYGVCYNRDAANAGKVTVNISYGGLLMKVQAEERVLKDIELDDRIYCLVRKN